MKKRTAGLNRSRTRPRSRSRSRSKWTQWTKVSKSDWARILCGASIVSVFSVIAVNRLLTPHDSLSSMEASFGEPHEEAVPLSEEWMDRSQEDFTFFEKAFHPTESMDLEQRIDYWGGFLGSQPKAAQHMMRLMNTALSQKQIPRLANHYENLNYVETVVALAQSEHSAEWVQKFIAIHYKNGQSGWAYRNYFIDVDWIPNNLRVGLLEDITKRISRLAHVPILIRAYSIIRMKWLKEVFKKHSPSRELASMNSSGASPLAEEVWENTQKAWSQAVPVEVPYISVLELKKALPYIPTGSILGLVHQKNARHAGLIEHLGFVVRDGNRVLFRHALGRNAPGKIITQDLLKYVSSLSSRQKRRWALIGVTLLQVKASSSDKSFFNSSM